MLLRESQTLNINDLQALFNKEILALVVHDYHHYADNARICDQIKQQSSSSYEYEGNVVSHIGNSSYEIDDNSEASERYYSNVSKNYLTIQQIFSPAKTPAEYLEQDLNTLWKPGLNVENFHGKDMFAGLIRIIHKGSAVHAHQDLVSWSNPTAVNVDTIIGQFGVNYFLQVPKQGGHLFLWNKHLSYEQFNQQSNNDYCIPIDQLPPPDLKIKPAVGMLVFLNSHHLHAVETSLDNDRIASSFFLAYRSPEMPLTYWI